MADDIVTRLRGVLNAFTVEEQQDTIDEAAEEIERLQQQNAAWQETIRHLTATVSESDAEIERLKAELDSIALEFDEAREENTRLSTKIDNLQAHIQWLTQIAQERIYG